MLNGFVRHEQRCSELMRALGARPELTEEENILCSIAANPEAECIEWHAGDSPEVEEGTVDRARVLCRIPFDHEALQSSLRRLNAFHAQQQVRVGLGIEDK